jgi:Ser/Thr protein kinase RdoA (MazF antagonist)
VSGVELSALTALETVIKLARKSLESWPGITGAPELVMHRENTVFRVDTQTGPAALRIHRKGYHSIEAMQSELDWMAHLAANGLAVPAPFRSASGTYLVEVANPDGERRVVDLLTWLEGTPLGKTGVPLPGTAQEQAATFHALGAAMARLHRVSDVWTRPAGFQRHAWDVDGLAGETPLWGPFWEISDGTSEELRLLETVRDAVRADLVRHVEVGADYGLIHADLVRENVLVHDGEIRMIDFDDAGFGYRLFDIATALFKNRTEPNFEKLKSALLDGYLAERQLTARDIEALPLFLLLRALTYLGWGEARRHEPGMDERRKRFKADALALARTYLAERR